MNLFKFKTKIFKKIFIMYSIVIISIMLFLSIIVTNNIKNTIKNNQIYLNQRMIEDINDYFGKINENTKIIFNNLYQNQTEYTDIINYLTLDFNTYLKKRIDDYCNTNLTYYYGIKSYVKSCFEYNSNIENVIFYSNTNDLITVFNCYGNNKYILNVSKKINHEINEDKLKTSLINLINSEINKDNSNSYYIIHYIKDSYSLNNIGLLIIRYKLNFIENIIKKYENINNQIIIVDKSGLVIFDSYNKYTNQNYPYFDKLKITNKPIMFDEDSYISIAPSKYGVIVIGILPVKNIFYSNKFAIYICYILSFILITLAEVITFFKIDNLSIRTKKIIDAMKQVKNGNIKTTIESFQEDDEITLIANSFNDMCLELNNYINKVYIAQLKQKNAEILALQNQINPHFLYNTLESIRMKAISNGNKDIGKMLYNLAVLFRNMIKGKNLITIQEEIYNCKLYLELFKFRYDDKFNYQIDLDEKLKSKSILKFTIQPVIENFIIHGIRLESNDNFILITIKENNEDIMITIKDNGIGISPEKVEDLNRRMMNLESTESLGLTNVNERLKLFYGEKYGITISSMKYIGTIVNIIIPNKEVD